MECQSEPDQPSSLCEARGRETVFWKNAMWKRKTAKMASQAEPQTALCALLGPCGSAGLLVGPGGGGEARKDKVMAAGEADIETN